MTTPVYILGGYQTDFARNWTKENKHISAMIREAVEGTLSVTGVAPEEIQTGHVGNFAAELYAMQGHLGAFLVDVDPSFAGLPTARHEAACASGSIALLAASAELEAERYDVALVVGVEQMKTVNPTVGGDFLGTAAWYELEAKGVEFPFPKLFGKLGDEYQRRYGLRDDHLAHISAVNYSNAKRNPRAQTRTWYMSEPHARGADRYNAIIGGRLKVSDCSQVTDGAVGLVLASARFASEWAARRGISLARVPRIEGWGHEQGPPVRPAAHPARDHRCVSARWHRRLLVALRD
jgi:acetyl-CoA C-acetyltransferase